MREQVHYFPLYRQKYTQSMGRDGGLGQTSCGEKAFGGRTGGFLGCTLIS